MGSNLDAMRARALVTTRRFGCRRALSVLPLLAFVFIIPTDAAAIYTADGTLDGPCAWASVVRLDNHCTGTLITEDTVLTAAHCGSKKTTVARFGELGLDNSSNAAATVKLTNCVKHHDYVTKTNGVDLMVCKINPMDSAPDVPIVPIMVPTGPARDWLRHEIHGYVYKPSTNVKRPTPEVIPVGAGTNDAQGHSGDKLQGSSWMHYQHEYDGSATKLRSGDGYDLEQNLLEFVDTEYGDSGGPLMVRMRDGSWRQIGALHSSSITSGLDHEAAPPHLAWIEEQADGNDDTITPCHDYIDGKWVWLGSCQESFPLNPDESYEASWDNACAGATYGGGYYSNADFTPPGPDSIVPSGEAGESPLVPLARLEIIHAAALTKAQAGDFGSPASQSAIADYFIDEIEDDGVFPFLEMIHDGGNRGAYVSSSLEGDFDGDGQTDSIHGFPYANCAKGEVVEVLSDGTTTAWSRSTPGVLGTAACGDHLGAAITVADFNADGRDDVAISAPGSSAGDTIQAGSVTILYGSSTGLSASGTQLLDQDNTGTSEIAEDHDFVGEALAGGDFDCDGYDDLAIGVPREDDGPIFDAGATMVLHGSEGGLTTTSSLVLHQGVGGVDDSSEPGDLFGAALAAGNFDGDSDTGHACVDLAIAAPFEDIGPDEDAGSVYVIRGSSTGLTTSGDQRLDQGQSMIADNAEAGDMFGATLAVEAGTPFDGLIVQVPGEQCSALRQSTGQHAFLGGSGGLATGSDVLDCEEVTSAFNSHDWGVLEHAVNYHAIGVLQEM